MSFINLVLGATLLLAGSALASAPSCDGQAFEGQKVKEVVFYLTQQGVAQGCMRQVMEVLPDAAFDMPETDYASIFKKKDETSYYLADEAFYVVWSRMPFWKDWGAEEYIKLSWRNDRNIGDMARLPQYTPRSYWCALTPADIDFMWKEQNKFGGAYVAGPFIARWLSMFEGQEGFVCQ